MRSTFVKTPRLSVRAAATVFSCMLLAASFSSSMRTQSRSTCVTQVSATPTNGDAVFKDDLARLDAMIQHDAGAMSLANQALQHAANSRVRRLALRIVENRAGEIQQLRQYRSRWYPNESSGSVSEFPTLCAAGKAFDQNFLRVMIAHQQLSVSMLTAAIDSAMHTEFVEFARTMRSVRQDEIEMLATLLTELDEIPTPAT